MSGYFSVKGYEEFQHYKDRNPPWIKFYNKTLDDYELGLLPDASKAHLYAIWLLASRYNNRIPYDAEWIARKINATEPVDLELLAKTLFIIPEQGCSETLASRKQSACLETETETETEKKLPSNEGSPPDKDLREAVSLWNALADKHGLTKVQRLTAARRKVLQARLRDAGGLDGWREALSLVAASGFLTGREKDWAADFDFITKSKNFTKLMEGGYADRRASRDDKPRGAHETLNAAFADVAERLKSGDAVEAGPGAGSGGLGAVAEGVPGGVASLPPASGAGLGGDANHGPNGPLVDAEPARGPVANYGAGLGESAPGHPPVRPGRGHRRVPEDPSPQADTARHSGGSPEGHG